MERARIAVVEDDASVRDAITLLLKAEGWAVESYSSGQQFLAALQIARPPSCVVLDLMLPGMNGVDVMSRLHAAKVSIVVLTAYPSSDIAAQARALGAKTVLTKPVQPDRLTATLRTYLNEP